jgi:DNA-binding LytR/AlgR family response regulator
MKCIALDDEPLALNVIEGFCKKIAYISSFTRCSNAVDAVKVLYSNDIDLIFLDIQMPGITGLEFIKTLPKAPLIIFTTAYSHYALEGFELNAVDYLLKPFSFERFLKAVNKAYELVLYKRTRNVSAPLIQLPAEPDYIMIKVEYDMVKLNLNDIEYVEGLKDYVKIFNGNRLLLTKSTMKNMEQKLPSGKFIRVHKSYIVAISKINAINNNRVVIGEKKIPIGNQYKKEFFEMLKKTQL